MHPSGRALHHFPFHLHLSTFARSQHCLSGFRLSTGAKLSSYAWETKRTGVKALNLSIFAVLREWVQGRKRVELWWKTDGCKALRWGVEIGHTLRLEPRAVVAVGPASCCSSRHRHAAF